MSGKNESSAELRRRIAELELANAELVATARRSAEIADTAPDALLVVDEKGRIVFVNRRVRQLFGYGSEDLLGQPLDSLLPERYRGGHGRHLRHFFARPKARSMGSGLELWARRADGTEFPVEISLSPIKYGEQTLVASAIRDASERREIERSLQDARVRAEAASAEKTRFIAAASHDLRQPLQAAAIYLDLLTDEALDPARRPATAKKAKDCVDSLRALLNKVLHISKLDAGAVTARRTDFRVQALFDRLAAKFQPLAAGKGLDLRVRLTTASAHSDPILTGQILENFVSNAVRYTTSGGILVGCRRRDGRLRLQVWDTGVGIGDDDREKIFGAFYRAGEGPTVDASGGIGLGLAIVAELGSLLDHPIEVHSRRGKGSLFELVLPAAKETRAAAPAIGVRAAGPARAVIAVVDDNPAIVDALRTVLEVAGNTVVSAATGEDLLAKLRGHAPPVDALVTDFRLRAGTTGLETLETIRREFGSAIPAIVLTGDSSFEALERRSGDGRFRVLAKPVDAKHLLAELADCLSEPVTGG